MVEPRRLLILGGTSEAAELARLLAPLPDFGVITSLAGRTSKPAALPGELRVGGFGGVEGLCAYLEEAAVDAVVDATHPFAAVMPHNAAAACTRLKLPRLRLLRPAWQPVAGDRWTGVPDLAGAARAVGEQARRVFLATGRQGIEAFTPLATPWFLVRLIDRPAEPLPLARHELVMARGPFPEAEEFDLLRERRIELLVSKNSGGKATYGKIAAARRLELPVVLVARPAQPAGDSVPDVASARAWVASRRPL
ncbi:MAG: cobalt-precorrin-6A reductase [Pseudomonadota bacterium]